MATGVAAWGDYDRDGDLDLQLTGTTDGTPTGAIARLYRNDRSAPAQVRPLKLDSAFVQ